MRWSHRLLRVLLLLVGESGAIYVCHVVDSGPEKLALLDAKC